MAIFSWKLSILDRSGLKTVVKNAYCQIVGSAVLYVDFYNVQIMVNPAYCPGQLLS